MIQSTKHLYIYTVGEHSLCLHPILPPSLGSLSLTKNVMHSPRPLLLVVKNIKLCQTLKFQYTFWQLQPGGLTLAALAIMRNARRRQYPPDWVDPIFEVFMVGSGKEQSGSQAILSSEPSAKFR